MRTEQYLPAWVMLAQIVDWTITLLERMEEWMPRKDT